MRIAFCHHLSMGYNAGGEQEIAQIAVNLARRGHSVQVHALPFTLGHRSLVDPKRLLGDLRYDEKWFHKIECDVAYVTYSPLCLLNFRISAPKVAGFHSHVWFRKPTLSYGFIPFLAKMTYDAVGRPELERFAALHIHDAYLERVFAFLNKPTHVIPHPVDTNVFRPKGSKNGKFRVLYCGRPIWAKGFDVFLELAAEMKDEGIEFAWLGGNEEYPNVRTLGFSGPSGVASAMATAHVLIEPQRINTVGRTALESVAVGTTVLLRSNPTTIPALPSLVAAQTKEEMRGHLTEMRDVWQHKTMTSPVSSDESFERTFSIDAVTDAYEEMFLALG